MDNPRVLLSTVDDRVAIRKGDLLAAKAIAENPDQRKRVEDAFGVEFCKRKWPEAYSPSPFFRRLIDKVKFMEW